MLAVGQSGTVFLPAANSRRCMHTGLRKCPVQCRSSQHHIKLVCQLHPWANLTRDFPMKRKAKGSQVPSANTLQTTKVLSAATPQQWQTAFSEQEQMMCWMYVMLLGRLRLRSGISAAKQEVMMTGTTVSDLVGAGGGAVTEGQAEAAEVVHLQ